MLYKVINKTQHSHQKRNNKLLKIQEFHSLMIPGERLHMGNASIHD